MSEPSTGPSIAIRLNGKIRDVPDGLTLTGLLGHLHVKRDRVAIERNREIVSAALWDSTPVEHDDEIEVVHFVGGGSMGATSSGAIPKF